MMYQQINQYTILQAIVILAVTAITIDSLIESHFQWQVPTTGQQSSSGSQLSPSLTVQNLTEAASTNADKKQRARYFQLPIDHGDHRAGFFDNRYWVNDDFYQPGGPIFVHDTGESDAETAVRKHLFKPNSYLQRFLEEFHGAGIVWEHRYYGDSLPFPITVESQFSQMRGLSFGQALADLPYFSQNFSLPGHPNDTVTPTKNPWVLMGCSYSGLRAAASRLLYPRTFFAAYAASAPVQLQVELDTFFDAVYAKMVDRGYTSCATDLHSITLYLDGLLADSESAILAKRLLLGPGAEENSNGDFALAIANIFSYFQGRGITGGQYSLDSLCAYLEQSKRPRGESSEDRGLLETFAAWPGLRAIVNSHFNTSCGAEDADQRSCNLAQVDTDTSSISWTWQLCSELGLLVTRNRGPSSLVSRFLSLEYRRALCERQFPQFYAQGLLPAVPPVNRINKMTGGRLMRPSNTFWTAGQYDPWRVLTPLAANNSMNDSIFSIVQDIPDHNATSGEEDVFGYLLEDSQHCFDWSVKNTEAEKARALFSQALKQWLPYYRSDP